MDIHSSRRWHDAGEASFANWDLGGNIKGSKIGHCLRICQFCDSKLNARVHPWAVAQCTQIDQDENEMRADRAGLRDREYASSTFVVMCKQLTGIEFYHDKCLWARIIARLLGGFAYSSLNLKQAPRR